MVRRIVQAEDANGGPLTTHKLLTLLRKLAPKTIAPLVKRGKLQQDGLIAPLDEGLWVVTDAGRARL